MNNFNAFKISFYLIFKNDIKDYTEMQDLLYGFHNPCIMDIKIGIRTFLENDLDDKETKPRRDLYMSVLLKFIFDETRIKLQNMHIYIGN